MKKIFVLLMILIINISSFGITTGDIQKNLDNLISYTKSPNLNNDEKTYLKILENKEFSMGVIVGTGLLDYNSNKETDTIRVIVKGLEKYYNIKIRLVFVKDEEELVKLLREGKIDFSLYDSFMYSNKLLKSLPITKKEYGIYSHKSENLEIKNLYISKKIEKQLKNVEKFKEFKKTFKGNINIIETPLFSVLSSNENGMIDSSFYMQNYMNFGFENMYFEPISTSYVSFIFKKDFNINFFGLINKGINYEFGKFLKNYFSEINLENKKIQFSRSLTREEKIYLIKNPVLKAYLQSDYFPQSFYNKDKKEFDGYFVNTLKEFVKYTGQKLEIQNEPYTNWEELSKEFLTKKNGFLILLNDSSNFNSKIVTTKNGFEDGVVLTGKSESLAHTDNPLDYLSYSIGAVSDNFGNTVSKKYFSKYGNSVIFYSNYTQLINALNTNEVQYIIMPKGIGKYYRSSEQQWFLKNVAKFYNNKVPIAVNKEDKVLIGILEKINKLKIIDFYYYNNELETYNVNFEQELAKKNIIIKHEFEKQKKHTLYLVLFLISSLGLLIFIFFMYKRVKNLNKNLYNEMYFEPHINVANKRLFLENKEKIKLELGDGVLCISITNQNEINQIYTFQEGEELRIDIVNFLKTFIEETVIDSFYFVNGIYVIILRKLGEALLCENIEKIRILFKKSFGKTVQIKISYAIKEDYQIEFNEIFEQAYFLINSSTTKTFVKATSEKLDEQKELIYLAKDLPRALIDNEIIPFFQPKISCITGKVTGTEALARWIHNERGLIPPSKFIEKAEQNGNIIDVDLRIADLAIAGYKRWISKKLVDENFVLSFNLSPVTLGLKDIDEIIIGLVDKYQVNPKNIEVEVTERVVIENYEHFKNIISKLREVGILVAIDDFSAGNASLDYILKIDFTTLKIDRSLLTGISYDNRKKIEICKAIVDIGKKLKMKVIAEGVETIEEANLIKSLKVHEIQGYFYSKPVSENNFIDYVKEIKAVN